MFLKSAMISPNGRVIAAASAFSTMQAVSFQMHWYVYYFCDGVCVFIIFVTAVGAVSEKTCRSYPFPSLCTMQAVAFRMHWYVRILCM